MLAVGCAPADGAPPEPPSPTPVVSGIPTATSSGTTHTVGPTPSRSESRPPTPSETLPSLPVAFPIDASLLDGGAALAVRELHEISGLRPALKLNVSEAEVVLTVLTLGKQARSYQWRDGVITQVETDVQYLRQTIFWPTDFDLQNVRRIFDVAVLLGTSSNGQVLQVVEYRPGHVFMSVTTSPETNTIFFQKDGTVFRNLDTTSVADIRDGIAQVTTGAALVYSIGFDAERGYFAERPSATGEVERRVRMANRPAFSSKRTGAPALKPFAPQLVDPAAIAQAIASHDTGEGCAVEIDNRFDRVQPVVTYQCGGKTFRSDMKGVDLTDQLR